MQRQVGLDHVYFIFADNCYEKKLTDQSFRALLNFYLLLYNKVVIPDVYFINNQKLFNFLSEGDNLKYVENGIIIPSVREGRNSFEEIYQTLKMNNTVINDKDNELELLRLLEKIDIQQAVKWDLDKVASNFTTNFKDNIHILSEANGIQMHLNRNYEEDALLTRVELHKMASALYQPGTASYLELMNYIDITYNFNLPNLMEFSAAYPSTMESLTATVTPESVFIKDSMMEVQKKVIMEDRLNTNFFNTSLLASLNYEQIEHFKSLSQHKKFVKAFTAKNKRGEKIGDRFIDYLHIFNKELPRIINPSRYEEIRKLERTLSLKNYLKDYIGGEGSSIVLETALNIGFDTVAGGVIGKAFNVILTPLTAKNQNKVKDLELKGEDEVNGIRYAGEKVTILDSFKEFSISNLQR